MLVSLSFAKVIEVFLQLCVKQECIEDTGSKSPEYWRSVGGRAAWVVSPVQLFVTPWLVACWVLLSMGFSRQEYRRGLPIPLPGDLLDPGI